MIWLDVFEAAGSAATAGALFFIAASTAHAKKAAIAAEQQLSVERARDDERCRERARAQAHQISTWPAIRHLGRGQQEWGIVIANASDDPIYDVTVARRPGIAQGGSDIAAIRANLKVVPPGLYFLKANSKPGEMPRALPRVDLEPIFKNLDYCAELTFRDSSSATWRRSRSGVLTALDTEIGS
ncbi:hypothetical protein [Sinomonas gamaensis]|uniref:hypothetical protein n=1 Tax=Sinomonas gamaensis TaxID=2565624 RepID=UPI0011095508|nr:hypothetical protein [Sinomonas gamaensis]